MAQPKRSETTIVQELLAFVQNKLDVMDELSLEQICTSSFTEADILAAKKVLADTAITTARFITRRRNELSGKKDLQDIFRVLKETEPDDVPTYVARDLNRLPPVTWDHVDVTRFMKDILQLREEVSSIKRKLETAENNVADLNKELAALRVNAAPTVLLTTQNIDTNRGSGRCDISSVSISPQCTTDTVSQGDDLATCVIPVTKNVSSQPKNSSSARPVVPSRDRKKTYAQASRPSPAAAPATQQKKEKPTSVPDLRKTDSDGFTLVERSKHRHRNRNLNKRGTATTPGLKAVEPTFLLYLSRVDPSTAGADVAAFVKKRLGDESLVVHLQRLESSVRKTNFKSYLLRVPAKHKSALFSPDFWPKGLVFRRYWEATRPGNPSQNILI